MQYRKDMQYSKITYTQNCVGNKTKEQDDKMKAIHEDCKEIRVKSRRMTFLYFVLFISI